MQDQSFSETPAQVERRAFLTSVGALGLGLFSFGIGLRPALAANTGPGDAQKAQDVVNSSTNALSQMLGKPEGASIRALMRQSRGVVILPSLLKGAFIFGGQGGTGVLVARNTNGTWSAPAFYTAAGASWGLQVGIEDTAVLMILMNQNIVNKIAGGGAQLGVDASLAAGPAGGGTVGVNTTQAYKDIYYYNMTNQGLFAGISLQGAGLAPRDDLNHAYYNAANATAQQIISGMYSAPGARSLRTVLAQAVGGQRTSAGTRRRSHTETTTTQTRIERHPAQ